MHFMVLSSNLSTILLYLWRQCLYRRMCTIFTCLLFYLTSKRKKYYALFCALYCRDFKLKKISALSHLVWPPARFKYPPSDSGWWGSQTQPNISLFCAAFDLPSCFHMFSVVLNMILHLFPLSDCPICRYSHFQSWWPERYIRFPDLALYLFILCSF